MDVYSHNIRVQYTTRWQEVTSYSLSPHWYTNQHKQEKIGKKLNYDKNEICLLTLFGSGVSFHMLVEGGSVDEGFLALSALELLYSRVCRNVSGQVGVH